MSLHKRDGETYTDYKKRVLDSISPSFCAAKWNNATIFLNQGTTMSCHHPVAHPISPFEIFFRPSALHNTKQKKEQRKQMLRGERPSGCNYCWSMEDLNDDIVSDRVYKSVIYPETEVKNLAEFSPEKNVNPRTLELSFSRACNFACSYCNVDFSTSWLKDIKENGEYKNLKTHDSMTYQNKGKPHQFENDKKNPYIKAFWRWWPSLSKDLTELRITGGEPLMSKDVWHLVDELKKEKNKHIQFAINSNLGASPKLIERLVEQSHDLAHLEVYTSNESTGEHAEYIRDGLNYKHWIKNCKNLLLNGKLEQLHIMMTINALCLERITDLFDEILKWRQETGRFVGAFTLNILRFPAFMSVLTLPQDLRNHYGSQISSWLEKHRTDPLGEMEVEGIERLVGYLAKGESPHPLAEPQNQQWRDLRIFFQQYDQRRNKSFEETFSGPLSDWYSQIPPV